VSLSTSVDRVPPQNLDAEQGVLGSMLLDRDAIARVVELVRAEDFYRDAHRRIYESITARLQGRRALDLYHTAMRVHVPRGTFVVETMWPTPAGFLGRMDDRQPLFSFARS